MRTQAAETSVLQWLLNPFRYVAGFPALVVGLGVVLISGLLGSVGTVHFDGTLDVHIGAKAPLWVFLVEGPMGWLCLCAALFILGAVFHRRRSRLIDVMGTQALARTPLLAVALIALPAPIRDAFVRCGAVLIARFTRAETTVETGPADGVIFALVMLVMIVAVIWMVALMYRGYVVSCNARGGRGILTFIAGLLVAEVLSKIILWVAIVPYLHSS